MDQAAIAAIFRPKLSKQEVKADEVTRNVRVILDAEVANRLSKTERLRSARVARDAQMAAAPVKKIRSLGSRTK